LFKNRPGTVSFTQVAAVEDYLVLVVHEGDAIYPAFFIFPEQHEHAFIRKGFDEGVFRQPSSQRVVNHGFQFLPVGLTQRLVQFELLFQIGLP
jgi:hypothetical protein